MSSSSPQRPLWVDMALSVIEKRKHAIWLIIATALFIPFFVPWRLYMDQPIFETWLFMADNWWYTAAVIAMLVYYLAAFRWMDKAKAWAN